MVSVNFNRTCIPNKSVPFLIFNLIFNYFLVQHFFKFIFQIITPEFLGDHFS